LGDSVRPKKLSNKQKIFIDEYLKCFNGAEAARRAGYAEESARVSASRNLSDPDIRAIVDARIAESQMSVDEALIRISQMARASITDVIDEYGEIDWEKVYKNGHLVKSISPGKFGTRIEIIDAQAALDKILRAHGKYKDNVDVTSGGEKIEIMVTYANKRDPSDAA
jgi:hypothetical protein